MALHTTRSALPPPVAQAQQRQKLLDDDDGVAEAGEVREYLMLLYNLERDGDTTWLADREHLQEWSTELRPFQQRAAGR